MTHIDFDFMTSVTMPNPRLCRIEVLKRSGNCVNPADPPLCHSAPCGIVRCASQESQRSPSGRLRPPFPLVSVIGGPASCICKAGFQTGPEDYANACLGRILSWPVPSFGYFHTRLAPDYA